MSYQILKDHLREAKHFKQRTLFISFVILLCGAAVFVRLYYLEIHQHSRYKTLSNQNTLNLVPVSPTRGLIYDRNGVLLAENIPVFSLEIIQTQVKNLKATIARLRTLVPISEENLKTFYKAIRQRQHSESVPLRLKLNPEERAIISVNLYHLPGVRVKARLIRHYPLGPSFAHVVGYVGRINEKELKKLDPSNYSGSNFIGKTGIEKFYETLLHGTVGYEQIETDARGQVVRTLSRTNPTPGNNLYLTIDSKLQLAVEKILSDHTGSVVAIEPSTGSVLAMVSKPSYDPNIFVKGITTDQFRALKKDPKQPLFNRAIQGTYPLASTIKPFLALQALDASIVSLRMTIRDPGWFKLPGTNHVYRDWRKGGHGRVNLKRAIIISCDTYFYRLASLLGITRIDSILTKFGFGIKTNIDMAGESPGLVPSPAWKIRTQGTSWYRGDTIVAGIGQGYLLTTPLQLANAISYFSMRGTKIRPHLQLAQQLPDRTIVPYKPEATFPIALHNPDNWNTIIDAMKKVISQGTGGGFGRRTPYTVAGKTGTAQIIGFDQNETVKKSRHLPKHLRDHSLFIAFAPVDHPKIALAVIIENYTIHATRIARKVVDSYLTKKREEHTKVKL